MYKELPYWYFKIAYFFVAHQVAFKRGVVVVLLLFNVLVWSWGVVSWVNYLISGSAHNYLIKSMNQDLVDYQTYKTRHQPQELQVIQTSVLTSTEKGEKYNFVAKVKNPNLDWAISKIKYRFFYSGGSTVAEEDFVMPQQEKFLAVFLQKAVKPVKNVRLDVLEINWRRVKERDKLDILSNLTFSDEKFSRLDKISLVDFKAINATPYNFWAVNYQVAVYQGSKIMAVAKAPLNSFPSLGQRQVQVSWLKYLPTPSKIEIVGDVNFLADVFAKSEFVPGLPKGLELENGR